MAVPHGSAPVRTVKRFHEEVGHLLVYRDGREERVDLRAPARDVEWKQLPEPKRKARAAV